MAQHAPPSRAVTASIARALAAALGGIAALLCIAGAAAQSSWVYAIEQHRPDQQANLCGSREEALRIAAVFAERGPRPGFTALADSEHCALEVRSFTPIEVLDAVVIAPGEPNEYTVSFVTVRLRDGPLRYLVTTRAVLPAR